MAKNATTFLQIQRRMFTQTWWTFLQRMSESVRSVADRCARSWPITLRSRINFSGNPSNSRNRWNSSIERTADQRFLFFSRLWKEFPNFPNFKAHSVIFFGPIPLKVLTAKRSKPNRTCSFTTVLAAARTTFLTERFVNFSIKTIFCVWFERIKFKRAAVESTENILRHFSRRWFPFSLHRIIVKKNFEINEISFCFCSRWNSSKSWRHSSIRRFCHARFSIQVRWFSFLTVRQRIVRIEMKTLIVTAEIVCIPTRNVRSSFMIHNCSSDTETD